MAAPMRHIPRLIAVLAIAPLQAAPALSTDDDFQA
jgi:hypothetical protein